jgi:hypothetical protein
MQHIITANDFRLGIRKKSVGIAKSLSLAPVDFRRFNADRDNTNLPRIECRKPLLETPQLGVTQWSPKTAEKNQYCRLGAGKQIGQRDRRIVLIRQREFRRFFARRVARQSKLALGVIRKKLHKKTTKTSAR